MNSFDCSSEEIDKEINKLELFMSGIELDSKLYRDRTVEMDFNGSLNPSILFNNLVFEKKIYVNYTEFWDLYYGDDDRIKLLDELYASRYKYMTKEDYIKGVKARIYRSYFGFLTEYNSFLKILKVFGKDAVTRSVRNDCMGVDITVKYNNEVYHIHIFVDTPISRKYVDNKINKKCNTMLEGIHVYMPYSINHYKDTIHRGNKLKGGVYVFPEKYVLYFKGEIDKGNLKNRIVMAGNDGLFVY